MLGAVRGDPLGLSKEKIVNPISLQTAQPGELIGGQSYGDPYRWGPSDVLARGTGRWRVFLHHGHSLHVGTVAG